MQGVSLLGWTVIRLISAVDVVWLSREGGKERKTDINTGRGRRGWYPSCWRSKTCSACSPPLQFGRKEWDSGREEGGLDEEKWRNLAVIWTFCSSLLSNVVLFMSSRLRHRPL